MVPVAVCHSVTTILDCPRLKVITSNFRIDGDAV